MPVNAINGGIEILKAIGMPAAQQNERSALTLLALGNLKRNSTWNQVSQPLIGVTPIMDWIAKQYDKAYAPNTRETIRRQTLHQFLEAGLASYNPDKPDRPVNSPKAVYQLTNEGAALVRSYGSKNWGAAVKAYLAAAPGLAAQYAAPRQMKQVPLKLMDGSIINLSPGAHSELIKDIVDEFAPRFAPGSKLIYVGDTGAKVGYFDKAALSDLGVTVDVKGKLPDVVFYDGRRDWLILAESVTSHGPIDGKRHAELKQLFATASAGLVFVTAFPDRSMMAKYLGELAWETEVWVADAPTHMMQLNGERFLGPY